MKSREQGLCLSQGLSEIGSTSKLTHMVIVRNWFSSLQVVLLRAWAPYWLPCFAHRAAHNMTAGFIKQTSERPRESGDRTSQNSAVFCILFIRSESMNRAYIQDEGIKQRCEYQERDHWKPYQQLLTVLNS